MRESLRKLPVLVCLMLPTQVMGQDTHRLPAELQVEIKISAGESVWTPAVTVHSMAPGPCLGVVVQRTDFHELVSDFDSLRVTQPDAPPLVLGRDEVELDSTNCPRRE